MHSTVPAGPVAGRRPDVVHLSGRMFLIGCAVVAGVILLAGQWVRLPVELLAIEVFATVVGLFLFGSFKYQIHKNALTYGMALVIIATFTALPTSAWHVEIAERGWWAWARAHLLTFHGINDLIHADTMLFILGLTFFVAVIAQTRLLEAVTFFLLRRNRGKILPTILTVTAVVAFFSGILDGVSMIGLTIRTLVIILMLAAAPTASVRYAVMVCTMVTTICGIWLAYGEPPNLIMKANLFPHLDNTFFLRYCAPAAVASFLIIAWQLRKKLGGECVNMQEMDIVDANAGSIRFLQATHHGEVFTPIELTERFEEQLGEHAEGVQSRVRGGQALGLALVRAEVPEDLRKDLLAHYASDSLAESLDRHYQLAAAGDRPGALAAEQSVRRGLEALGDLRLRAQGMGAVALFPFIGLLIAHSLNHDIPLFVASFAGFLVALLGIMNIPKMRALALHEARHEFSEYYFLFPLFLSITLLTKADFFSSLQEVIQSGTQSLGAAPVAMAQFVGSTVLSAILDNNVVADFASRALLNLDIAVLHLFAMAQIAGYALGGCWSHIGSAQSVVAFSFIRREVDEGYTPVQWIREMTPLIVEIMVMMFVLIYLESKLLEWLH